MEKWNMFCQKSVLDAKVLEMIADFNVLIPNFASIPTRDDGQRQEAELIANMGWDTTI